jgi:hypothetical protein
MSYGASVYGNDFSRTRFNEAKMGAYYTDVTHCKSLRGLFKFPEEEVSVLEPSIGDGSAVKAITEGANAKIFGVELNPEVAGKTKESIEDCLQADFLNGVRISHQCFSFIFANPPYLVDDEVGRKRMEYTFLQKLTENYISKDGVLVYIINMARFNEPDIFRYLYNHYEILGVWQFRPDEFAKYKQVAVVGRKRPTLIHVAADVQAAMQKYSTLPVLPERFDAPEIAITPSPSEKVTLFAPLEFDEDAAASFLLDKTGTSLLSDYHTLINRLATQKKYQVNNLGRPPIPPKKDSLYLLATSGAGQGIAGEKGEDLHLQRGVAKVVETTEQVPSEDDKDRLIEKVTTSTEVTMTILECSGKITVLK